MLRDGVVGRIAGEMISGRFKAVEGLTIRDDLVCSVGTRCRTWQTLTLEFRYSDLAPLHPRPPSSPANQTLRPRQSHFSHPCLTHSHQNLQSFDICLVMLLILLPFCALAFKNMKSSVTVQVLLFQFLDKYVTLIPDLLVRFEDTQ